MKFEKMLIGIILVSSLFFVSIAPVEAAGEPPVVVIDEEDDVINYFAETNDTTNEYPNIDIVKLEYARDGTQVTVALTVKGEIENLGDIEGQNDMITYGIILDTSANEYAVEYVNQNCYLITDVGYENLTDYMINGPQLVIRFTLNTTNETYKQISAESMYIKIGVSEIDTGYFIDDASDQPLEITFTDIPGERGKLFNLKYFQTTVTLPIHTNGTLVMGRHRQKKIQHMSIQKQGTIRVR
jgi:hypothetical protein